MEEEHLFWMEAARNSPLVLAQLRGGAGENRGAVEREITLSWALSVTNLMRLGEIARDSSSLEHRLYELILGVFRHWARAQRQEFGQRAHYLALLKRIGSTLELLRSCEASPDNDRELALCLFHAIAERAKDYLLAYERRDGDDQLA